MCSQRYDLVPSHRKFPLPGFAIMTEDDVDQIKDLLHDSVLTKVIFSLSLKLSMIEHVSRHKLYRERTSCLYERPSLPWQTVIFGKLTPPAVEN